MLVLGDLDIMRTDILDPDSYLSSIWTPVLSTNTNLDERGDSPDTGVVDVGRRGFDLELI